MQTLIAPAPGAPPAQPTETPLVSLRNLTRVWGRGDGAQVAVDRVDLDIAHRDLIAIVGPSGSGKSTLAALIAGLDTPTAGSVVIGGTRLDTLSEDARARWRSRQVGIVFQDFHLLPTLTASENVELTLKLRGMRRGRRKAATGSLAAVGLTDKSRRLPAQLSGGEQQRVSIARAVVARPRLLVADEPTGSLDTASGRQVFDLITGLRKHGTTVVFITHDEQLAAAADRVVTMIDGRVATDERTTS